MGGREKERSEGKRERWRDGWGLEGREGRRGGGRDLGRRNGDRVEERGEESVKEITVS